MAKADLRKVEYETNMDAYNKQLVCFCFGWLIFKSAAGLFNTDSGFVQEEGTKEDEESVKSVSEDNGVVCVDDPRGWVMGVKRLVVGWLFKVILHPCVCNSVNAYLFSMLAASLLYKREIYTNSV